MNKSRLLGAARFLIITASIPLSANAAYIDNNIFTTDTGLSLDWLDLTETVGLSMSDALTANSGWRYATNAEVENLFGNLFQGYYDTGTLQGVSTSTEGAYANQETDIYNFIGLFGNTNTTGSNQALSYGFFRDESNVQRLAGVNISLAPINPLSQVLSPEYYPNYSGRTLDVVGTYLVRTSVIPIPAALWLFGSGLLGLIGMARRKP